MTPEIVKLLERKDERILDLTEENARLKKLLQPLTDLAIEVVYNSNIKRGQTVYAYNKAEITFDHLEAILKELTNSYEPPTGK